MLDLRTSKKTLATGLVLAVLVGTLLVLNPDRSAMHAVIVQGQDLNTIKAAVQAVGGEVTHELGIINAVGANSFDHIAALFPGFLASSLY